MHTRQLGTALVACGFTCAVAIADPLPPSQMIRYSLHAQADDPHSPIAWTITMRLDPIERNGDVVQWHVAQADVYETATDTTWRAGDPDVDVPGGDWLVTHADAENPLASEFARPPEIWGTAVDVAGLEGDLDFTLAGAGVPGATVLSYSFAVHGEAQPRAAGSEHNNPVDGEADSLLE